MLLGLDADDDALQAAGERLKGYPNKILRQGFFDQLELFLTEENLLPVTGVLFDLGISSFQIDQRDKGFSFQADGPLDMRFNRSQKLTAETVINEYPGEELERILYEYGEEKQSRRITRQILKSRTIAPIKSTLQLSSVLRSAIPERYFVKSMARIFQAIRIEVNDELGRLKRALEASYRVLEKSGRMVFISYHSLEDRLIKNFFKEKAQQCTCPPEFPECICGKSSELRILTKKMVRPDAAEIANNPRSRSAKLRAAEKIADDGEI
jgi:16S rRNA (cytosine1402-N4)-methyltransferase